ncbi:MAG TPA: class I SAM-dependent methyltransferase, partial [Tepidisphaeraceae bacterium]|nr:class I SAM-dependent methyltransferase [Tepidisphaeraceae bacterium]
MTQATQTSYLQPYLEAAREHGAGFGALLWASVRSQRARFAAICRAQDLTDKSVLDAGCGRADLMAYLSERGRTPADYIGLEAVPALADAADARKLPRTR